MSISVFHFIAAFILFYCKWNHILKGAALTRKERWCSWTMSHIIPLLYATFVLQSTQTADAATDCGIEIIVSYELQNQPSLRSTVL